MDFNQIIDLFLHLDQHLNVLIGQHNEWAYVVLFIVIFIETGLVVTPFLPGDSLIFAVGAVAAAGAPISIPLVIVLLYAAAIGGDTMNYHIGHLLQEKVRRNERIALIKTEYIQRTQAFFERHGGKTITIARFVPIIRTFAPFVAGACKMPYHKFICFNIAGGIAWVTLLFSIGYFFGNIPYIKDHFGLVVVAIVVISVLPAAAAAVRNKIKGRRAG